MGDDLGNPVVTEIRVGTGVAATAKCRAILAHGDVTGHA